MRGHLLSSKNITCREKGLGRECFVVASASDPTAAVWQPPVQKQVQTITRRTPTVLVGILWLVPASETAGVFEKFALRAGFAKTNPPSKTSISCGLP
ncbi:MAG TPA: hypothetical protein DCQ12_07415 [Candidatus Cloacimonas sp.]|nr:hypothetical protein [Candidatus Cloacimonas sp.]